MTQTLVLGTKNKHKLEELQKLLSASKIKVFSLDHFPGCREAKETGKTFEANAKIKARLYSKHTGALTLADDSGLMVNALNGRPGVYSARFAGPGCSYQDNNKKLLRLLAKTPVSRRVAKFVSVIAVYDNGKLVGIARGECRGKISFEVKGNNGSGYDPVFIPEGLSKTYAELSRQKKNSLSHRGKALRAAKRIVVEYLRLVDSRR